MAQKTNTCRFRELLKTSCHKLHYTRSCGLKQLVDYGEDTQTVYLQRANNVQSVWETKKTSQYEFGNGWRVSSNSTWCTATNSCYKRQAEIGQSCWHISTITEAYDLSKDVLNTFDSVFEESDALWKAAELEQLHDAMEEKLKTASYPEKIHVLTLILDKWSREYASN